MRTHVINFQERFASAVAAGTKRQTICRQRKVPILDGDLLNLGMWIGVPRRKGSRRTHIATGLVIYVRPLSIHHDMISGLNKFNRNAMARADGFMGWPEMRDWFASRYGLPFVGMLIRWELWQMPSGDLTPETEIEER